MTKLDLAFAVAAAGVLFQVPAFAGPIFGDDPPRDEVSKQRAERSEQ